MIRGKKLKKSQLDRLMDSEYKAKDNGIHNGQTLFGIVSFWREGKTKIYQICSIEDFHLFVPLNLNLLKKEFIKSPCYCVLKIRIKLCLLLCLLTK